MFGYVIPGLEALPAEERGRYQEAYCGLCRALGERYGQVSRLTLSYDMAFMSLVLGSLYEPEEHAGEGRCPAHPAKARPYVRTDVMDYAADLTVALAYFKCLDDWNDDRSVKARAQARALKAPYRAARERQPEACRVIEAAMADINAAEKAALAAASERLAASGAGAEAAPGNEPDADAVANRFGMLLGSLFAYRSDFWADDLRRFGARLGKFVYMMDAAVDCDDDAATGNYNPFVMLGTSSEDRRAYLEVLAGSMAEAFEKLPLERDLHLLRSVLYEGVWQRLNLQDQKRAEAERKRGGLDHTEDGDGAEGADRTTIHEGGR